jgi:hypothetical protein
MRRDLAGAMRALVLPTLALLAVVAFVPGRLTLVVRIYGLVVCAMALGLALAALRRAYPHVGQRAKSRPPPSLARIEDEAALGVASAFDLHFHLVPRVRAIAAGLLWSRRNSSLDVAPDTARSILGTETWELVRADRAAPADRHARGIPASELRRVVESLETV